MNWAVNNSKRIQSTVTVTVLPMFSDTQKMYPQSFLHTNKIRLYYANKINEDI